MRRVGRGPLLALLLAGGGASVVALFPAPVQADEPGAVPPLAPSERTPIFELAARSGYVAPPIRGAVNPFGAGFGARAGFDLGHLYLGAAVMDYLGGSDVGATDQGLLLGAELGYSGRVGRYVTIRPQLGVGDTRLSHTEPGTGGGVDVVTSASGSSSSTGTGGTAPVTTHVNNLYVQPGLTVIVAYRRFFVALCAGALVVPGITYGPSPAQETTWISFSLDGQLGFSL